MAGDSIRMEMTVHQGLELWILGSSFPGRLTWLGRFTGERFRLGKNPRKRHLRMKEYWGTHVSFNSGFLSVYGDGGGRGVQDGEHMYTQFHVNVWQNQYNTVK